MKRIAILSLVLLFALTACAQTAQVSPTPAPAATAAATAEPTPEPPLPVELDLSFLTGAGAWSTDLTLRRDGSFQGTFHDSDMGSTGPGYAGGTIYYANFSGLFTDISQVDDHTWVMTLDHLDLEDEPGLEEIEEVDGNNGEKVGVRYISAEAYGLEEGKTFVLFAPETSLQELDEEFFSWWPGRWEPNSKELTTLCCYGLWNKEAGYGFFGPVTYPEGFLSVYDEYDARQAATAYYEGSGLELGATPRIEVPEGKEGEIAFQIQCTKDGQAQPDRIIVLSRQNGSWVVMSEGA